jgi:hypothetical protein
MHEVVSKPHLDRHPDRIWTTVGLVHYIDLRWAEVSREKDWTSYVAPASTMTRW